MSSELGLCPERMFASFFFLLFFPFFLLFVPLFLLSVPSSCFAFSLFLGSCFFFRVCIEYRGDVPGVVVVQVIRDGLPQLINTVSLADWYHTAVRTISYLFVFSHRDAFLFRPLL